KAPIEATDRGAGALGDVDDARLVDSLDRDQFFGGLEKAGEALAGPRLLRRLHPTQNSLRRVGGRILSVGQGGTEIGITVPVYARTRPGCQIIFSGDQRCKLPRYSAKT